MLSVTTVGGSPQVASALDLHMEEGLMSDTMPLTRSKSAWNIAVVLVSLLFFSLFLLPIGSSAHLTR